LPDVIAMFLLFSKVFKVLLDLKAQSPKDKTLSLWFWRSTALYI